jgi:hypothetical protein
MDTQVWSKEINTTINSKISDLNLDRSFLTQNSFQFSTTTTANFVLPKLLNPSLPFSLHLRDIIETIK